jgi:hypothetical protein
MKTIQFETVLSHASYFEADNLQYIKLKEDAELTLPNLILNNEQSFEALGERRTRIIYDVRNILFNHISREVLHYIGDNPYKRLVAAEVFLISGLGQKLLANFYMKTLKPNHSSQILTTLEEALQWHEVKDQGYYLKKFND